MLGWFIVGVVIVVGVPVTMYFAQDSLLFLPQRLAGPPPTSSAGRPIETLAFDVGEGIHVRGWLAKSLAPRAPLVVYYGGNAEEVSWQARESGWPGAWSLALVNYRGYGASDGAPSEHSLFADALLVFDALASRPDIDASRIVLVGRSLGSGVATYVAAERAVAGVVLISPYDSITDVASRHYPWLPIGLLLRHPFDSHSRAARIHTPLLAIVGGRDTIIPSSHSRRLYEAWAGPKRLIDIPAADHNDITAYPAYWQSIGGFLRELHP
jgi:pimeloyl-ACP methyl ester carboxylesterase